MIVRLKLLVKYTDAVPELRVFDVLHYVKSLLVGVETVLQVFYEQVAMAQSCPSRAVFGINCNNLYVVFNRSLIVSSCGTVLRKLVDLLNLGQVAHLGLNSVVQVQLLRCLVGSIWLIYQLTQ